MNPFSKLSVKASMVLLTSVTLASLLGVGWISSANLMAGNSLAERLLDDIKLARAAGTADMMHDALGSDVLPAQATDGKASAADAEDLRKDLSEVEAVAGPALREALAKIRPDAQAYVKGAEKLASGRVGEWASGRVSDRANAGEWEGPAKAGPFSLATRHGEPSARMID